MKVLTNGAVEASRFVNDATKINFPKNGGGLSGALAGQTYSRIPGLDMGLVVCPTASVEEVMQLDIEVGRV